jgi:hypothetical protein
MHTSILLMDGDLQIILTPENDTDMAVLGLMPKASGKRAFFYKTQFRECQGGWYREFGPSKTLHDDLVIRFKSDEIKEDPADGGEP